MSRFKLSFYFDVISPYSFFAWRILQRYRPIWQNVEVSIKPFFLSGVMKSTGNKPPAFLPARAVYLTSDLERNAMLCKVPMLPSPSNFFTVARQVLVSQRMLVAAQTIDGISQEKFENLITETFRAIHQDPAMRNVENEVTVDEAFHIHCCKKAGMTSQETKDVLAAMNNSDVKAQLIANTEEAIEAGAFGAPSIVVSNVETHSTPALFFGSDRFEQLSHYIGQPYRGVCPDDVVGSKL